MTEKNNNKIIKRTQKKVEQAGKWQSPKSGGKIENPANLKRKQEKPLQKRLNKKELKSGDESNAGFRPEKY